MGHRLDRITDKGPWCWMGWQSKEIEADDVIIAIGFRADRPSAKEIEQLWNRDL